MQISKTARKRDECECEVASGTPGCPSNAEEADRRSVFLAENEKRRKWQRSPALSRAPSTKLSISLSRAPIIPDPFPHTLLPDVFPTFANYVHTYVHLSDPCCTMGMANDDGGTEDVSLDTRKPPRSFEEIAYRRSAQLLVFHRVSFLLLLLRPSCFSRLGCFSEWNSNCTKSYCQFEKFSRGSETDIVRFRFQDVSPIRDNVSRVTWTYRPTVEWIVPWEFIVDSFSLVRMLR